MKPLLPFELAAFAKQHRFAGGLLRRFRMIRKRAGLSVEFTLIDKLDRTRRIRLQLDGIEEFRLQKRPNSPAMRVAELRLGFFGDQIFLNLDDWALLPGDAPKVHDFRASDAYFAGRTLSWEALPKPTPN